MNTYLSCASTETANGLGDRNGHGGRANNGDGLLRDLETSIDSRIGLWQMGRGIEMDVVVEQTLAMDC